MKKLQANLMSFIGLMTLMFFFNLNSVIANKTISVFQNNIEVANNPIDIAKTQNQEIAGFREATPSPSFSVAACNFTITNNTSCSVYLYWFDGANYYTGASIPAFGSATETINDGDWWSAYNSADGSLITPYFSVASCASGSDVIPASACGSAPPPSSCNYTITNNTNCNVYLYWFDGTNYWTGASIPAYGSATEFIDDGDWWSAYNSADGSLITPYFSVASCSSGSDVIPASYCGSTSPNTCNFTVSNNTNCDVYLFWYDGANFWQGASIAPFGSATESIQDGYQWSAYNWADGSLITPSFSAAYCSIGSDAIPASACTATASTCNFTITNNTDCDVYLFWYDGANFWQGASIAPFGSATESIEDGYEWSAYNSADGSLITPTFSPAYCSVGSDAIPASACMGVPSSCNFTITNNTSCDVYLYWTDGSNFWQGASIPAFGSATESIDDGDLWSAYNEWDNTLITTTFSNASCAVGSDAIDASACSASCSDNIQNQGETGVDCGGPCPACASCNDGIQNQGEMGIDCGGPCPACASCNDGIQNQGETGIDCGGPCSPCFSCNDGIQNQGETGIDCGGPCPPCAISCSFTIYNNTNCILTILWNTNGVVSPGAIIPPNSSASQTVTDGQLWSAVNVGDGSTITPFTPAVCATQSATIASNLCGSVNNCADSYQDGLMNSSEYIEAPNFIISPTPGGTCIVSGPNADVTFDAGSYVELGAGFEVQLGTAFLADINGCNPSIANYNISNSKNAEINLIEAEIYNRSIQFYLDKNTSVDLYIVDTNGNLVEEFLFNQLLNIGTYTFEIDQQLKVGLYYLVVKSNSNSMTKMFILSE